VAANLKAHRLKLGFSQEELAHRAGVHRTYVGSVERAERNVSIDNIERFATALGVDLIDMVRLRRRSTAARAQG
jgi:transcriptional regulator with XRE-family HTH domain